MLDNDCESTPIAGGLCTGHDSDDLPCHGEPDVPCCTCIHFIDLSQIPTTTCENDTCSMCGEYPCKCDGAWSPYERMLNEDLYREDIPF